MAKIVRDGEIMVVCKEANDEAKIATDIKIAIGPRMGPERTAKIDSWLSGFPAPSPWSPMPAQETTPRVTRIYTEMMINIVRRSEEHTSELQSRFDLVCRLLLEKKNK